MTTISTARWRRRRRNSAIGEKQFCVYILASKIGGTLYIGVTSNLLKRLWEHQNHVVEGFTKRYGVTQLVYYEFHPTAKSAIGREKQMKEWKRQWKIELIEKANPYWHDLSDELTF